MKRATSFLLAISFATAAYVFAWPSPTFPYFAAVVVHVLGGFLFIVALVFSFRRIWRDATPLARIGWAFLALGAVLGAILIYTGTLRSEWTLLYVHIGACLAGGALLVSAWAGKRGFLAGGFGAGLLRTGALVVVAVLLAAGAWWVRTIPRQRAYRIENPPIAPASMD